jgi:hypothetical protein
MEPNPRGQWCLLSAVQRLRADLDQSVRWLHAAEQRAKQAEATEAETERIINTLRAELAGLKAHHAQSIEWLCQLHDAALDELKIVRALPDNKEEN